MASIRIDPSSSVPIFRQIVDGIRGAVAAGVYRPGDMIPSVRQLSVQILVNPNTVQRAYEALEREGLIQSRKGIGMEVSPKSQAIAISSSAEALKDALSAAIKLAREAGLSRTDVDAQYEQAWKSQSSRSRDKGGANG